MTPHVTLKALSTGASLPSTATWVTPASPPVSSLGPPDSFWKNCTVAGLSGLAGPIQEYRRASGGEDSAAIGGSSPARERGLAWSVAGGGADSPEEAVAAAPRLVRRLTRLRAPAGRGEMEVTGLSAPTVTVFISSSLNSFRSEKRYSRSLTIAEFKCKLELVVGSPASCMELELYGADEKFCCKLDQEDALLGSYPVDNGCRIHVIDHSGARLGEYEDVSKVEKYRISQEAYDQRQDSVRSFLKRSKLGRYNEEEQAQRQAETTQRLREEQEQASAIPVGSRCEVRAPGQPPRRGTVMYVGLTDFKPGHWIGIRYDEPLGKNDGSVNGKHYFECPAKYGAFVKPSVVTVGDFPEEDCGLDEM